MAMVPLAVRRKDIFRSDRMNGQGKIKGDVVDWLACSHEEELASSQVAAKWVASLRWSRPRWCLLLLSWLRCFVGWGT